jgi:hypothetical protein
VLLRLEAERWFEANLVLNQPEVDKVRGGLIAKPDCFWLEDRVAWWDRLNLAQFEQQLSSPPNVEAAKFKYGAALSIPKPATIRRQFSSAPGQHFRALDWEAGFLSFINIA